jgi:hypothetical protein
MVLKRIFSILIILPQLTFFACAQSPNSRMGNWGHMMGYGYGGGFMWLILVVLVRCRNPRPMGNRSEIWLECNLVT